MGTMLQPHPGWLPGAEPSRGMPALCWSFASLMDSVPQCTSSVTFELLGGARCWQVPPVRRVLPGDSE